MDLDAALSAAGANQGLMTPSMLRRAGIGRSALSRACSSGSVVRVRPSVYAGAPLDPVPRFVVTDTGVAPAFVAQVRAALLSLGGTATACGRTAAALRGWGMLVEPSRVLEVGVPHGRGRAAAKGVRVQQRRRLARERLVVLPATEPLWVSSSLRTVLDCCLTLPVVEAVVVCDSALRARAFALADLHAAASRLAGVRAARRVRRVLPLIDPESGSVLESVLRCRLMLAGVSGFTTQCAVFSSAGTYVLRVDFCFESLRLVVEADGAKWHPDPARDRLLDNQLACLGYRVLRYTWQDVVHDSDRVVAEVREALTGTRDIHRGAQFLSRAA